jgi:CheY-like chemotaxis protein
MADGTATGRPVLVVEDHEVEREGMVFILEREGYTVGAAQDADGATAFLRSHPETCVVLLDMMLPGRDGWAFLRDRLNDPALARVPALILTSLRVASQEWAQSLGAEACFRKPVPVAAMLDEVRRLCAA